MTNVLYLRGKITNEPKEFDGATKFTVGTAREYEHEGQLKQFTDWVNLTVLDKRIIEFVRSRLKNGDLVEVVGRVSETSYKKQGKTVYNTQVVVLEIKLLGPKSP